MNHLLIVDDNPVDCELARGLAERDLALPAQFTNNGVEAVEHLEASTPLAVLSDLQMPEMDGLALVRTMQRRFPTIPVILMTAYGSEEIALEALVEGAADYVPKHRLANDLPHILKSVLGIVSRDHRHEEIAPRLKYKQLRYSIESDLNLIPPLVDQLQQAATNLGLIGQGDRVRLARCLAEALRNALTHGCGGADDPVTRADSHPVNVTAEFTPVDARFVIRDSGPGFDPAAVVDPRQEPSRLTADSGRGLSLIRLFMDKVTFTESGNEITLVKRKPAAPGAH